MTQNAEDGGGGKSAMERNEGRVGRVREGKSNSCSSMCLPHTGMHLRMLD
jgi:hypothetical protein